MKNNTTEQLIWKYIDGDGTPEEIAEVERRLSEDPDFKSAFLQRKQLQESLEKLEPEQPSLRFSQNLMEKLPDLYRKFLVAPLIPSRWARAIIGSLSLFFLIFYTLIRPAIHSSSGPVRSAESFAAATETLNSFFQSVPGELFLILGSLGFGFIALVFIDQKLRSRFTRSNSRAARS